MTHAIDPFVLSLEREAPGATPMLRAVWHGLRGDWDAAHELAQAQDNAEARVGPCLAAPHRRRPRQRRLLVSTREPATMP